ncbi:hypothetical protein GGF32_001823 [Allomyces javanicus]|nr:hypothetical protein GGF32_001823 [Allomyces javanicus]
MPVRYQIATAICPQFVATIDMLDLGYLDESGVFFSIDSDSALRLAIAITCHWPAATPNRAHGSSYLAWACKARSYSKL